MYLDFEVEIPVVPGKISRFKKGDTVYVRYVAGRTYHPDKKYNIPTHKVIGKLPNADSDMMIPNENFMLYFGDTDLPELKYDASRSSCIRIGAFLVIRKVIEEYELPGMLMKYFDAKNTGLLLDLAVYSLVTENNAAQYYPSYAYNHPLMTDKMHIYSDTKISEFLASVTDDQRIGFLNDWNEGRDHRERIYISYDSTNKNSQAGDLEMVEFGHPKEDKGLPVFNYSIAYDVNNDIPLFYEEYPGSIVDITQLQIMLEKAEAYGYRHVGFILDRGYFSKENIKYMDACGFDFVIMVKGMASFVRELVEEVHGTFENKRDYSIRKYKAYGTTVKRKLFASDERERYFHIYYSDQKASAEREHIESGIEHAEAALNRLRGKTVSPNCGYSEFFHLEIYDKDGTLIGAREKKEVIEKALQLCGYFVIVTSERMTAKEALELYKSRDTSEKLFRGDKSYLGNKSLRVQSDESAAAKIFVEFIALIIRSRIYVMLREEKKRLEHDYNYMTVPAALHELEKIEMIRGVDGKYHMDHAVTKTQKVILGAFQMDNNSVRNRARELSEYLKRCSE